MTVSLAELLNPQTNYGHKSTRNVTPKRIARWKKQDELIRTLFNGHITFTQAAEKVGITRRQAYRWFNQWKQCEGVEIDKEWWQLYNRLLEEEPSKAFEGLTRLKYRMTPQHLDVHERIEEIKLLWQIKEPSPSKSTINPIMDNPTFITIPTDSASSHVEEDGAKPKQAQTKPSNEQSNQAQTA